MDGLMQSEVYDSSSPMTVYCTTIMRTIDGRQRVIMAISKKDVIILESKVINDRVETFTTELGFSKIPNTAEIQSIHCVNKSKEFDDFILGITYMSSIVRTYFVQQNAYLLDDVNKLISYIISRVVFNLRFDLAELLYEYLTRTKMERSFVGSHVVEEDKSETFNFNVYSGFPGSSLEIIMDNCETFKLDFIPYLLDHAIYLCKTHINGMWLLSGSDEKIHAYKSDKQQICEQKIEDYFTEFKDTNIGISINFGTKSFSDYKKRISFYGNDTGLLMFAIVDSEKNQILYSFTEHFLSPISVLKLFNIHNKTVKSTNILSADKNIFISDVHVINEKEPICFLVGSIIECAVVYMNILEYHLKKAIILEESNQYGGILSSQIMDINFDSKNEILIGTKEKYIISYIYKNNRWVKQQPYYIGHSVYTINYLDITGEGVNDVIILSKRGIHVLKHEPKDIVKILKNRLIH